MVKRIQYVDEEKMKISFSSFIFNVKSINENFGSLAAFAEHFDLWGETNGRLFCLFALTFPAHDLYERMEKRLLPFGLLKKKAFTYIIKHPLSEISLKHPSCVDISWLGSELNRKGNHIWYRDSKTASEFASSSTISSRSSLPLEEEQQLTFKVLDAMDPKPSFSSGLFQEVPYERFISFENNCLPVFIGTPCGTFPEEVIMEALEGQKIALFYDSALPITATILHIVNGKSRKINNIMVDKD